MSSESRPANSGAVNVDELLGELRFLQTRETMMRQMLNVPAAVTVDDEPNEEPGGEDDDARWTDDEVRDLLEERDRFVTALQGIAAISTYAQPEHARRALSVVDPDGTQPLAVNEILASHDHNRFMDACSDATLGLEPRDDELDRRRADNWEALKATGVDSSLMYAVDTAYSDAMYQHGKHMLATGMAIGALMQWRRSAGRNISLSVEEWREAMSEAARAVEQGLLR